MRTKVLLIMLLVFCYQMSVAQFITTWKTDNPGTSEDNQITIPVYGFGYNYDVDWGDGSSDTGITSNSDFTHTYATPGTYTVSISGDFPRIRFSNSGDKDKLLTVEQWGNNIWQSFGRAFWGCSNLTISARDAPDLSQVTDMGYAFANATSLNQSINHWDVSNVTDMTALFLRAESFNQPLGSWNVSSVTDFPSMFHSAKSFNQDIGNWNVSSATNMGLMFGDADAFNQNLGNWNVSLVTNMFGMFEKCDAFNGDLGNWNVSSVTNMNSMFSNAIAFNQNIGGWDVSQVTSMSFMFYHCRAFNSNIGNWNVSSVTDMIGMFNHASIFNQDIGNWNVSNVTDMSNLFDQAKAFNQDIGGWDVSQVTNMTGMFAGSAFNQDISAWDVSNVIYMNAMFRGNLSFNQPIGSWNVSHVTSMDSMFDYAPAFNQPLDSWDVSGITNMRRMFHFASEFNQDLGAWAVGNVKNMSEMFKQTSNFNQDISQWNVSGVTDMSQMFEFAASFNQNISTWDVGNVTNMSQMFWGTTFFNQDLGSWDVSQVTDMTEIFNCRNLSNTNYDKILNQWSGLPSLQSNVTLSSNGLAYCLGLTGRNKLINDYNWTISGDVESCAPQITPIQTFNIDENSSNGTSLGTLSASDPNQLDMTFSIVSGNDNNAFFIESQTGELTVSNTVALDYETNPVFELEVKVENENGSNSTTIVIRLNNLFDTPLITTWKTNNPGTSDDNQITIPTIGDGYNYSVDWGDGMSDHAVSGPITHTYADPGEYQVTIDGDFPRIYFNHAGDKDKILNILQWNDRPWTSMELAFAGCSHLTINTNGKPNLSQVESVERMFSAATSVNQGLENWDVSQVKNFSGMFSDASSFNGFIRKWDVSAATQMTAMFAGAESFNQFIDLWNVSQVIDMSNMFSGAVALQRGKFSQWNVSKVANMSFMFSGAALFNHDLSSWDVSNVVDMQGMFLESGLFAVNYDRLLMAWSELPDLHEGINVGVNGLFYCLGGEARDKLINDFGWSFSGDSQSCNPQIADQTFGENEDSQEGFFVGNVSANDPDGDVLSFSIVGGNLEDAFAIDSNTGAMTVNNPEVLDFEKRSQISATIQVSDNMNNTDTAEITVFLININEKPIVSDTTFNLPEPFSQGDVLGNVNAMDPENSPLTYEILNANNTFSIDSEGNIIILQSPSATNLLSTDNGSTTTYHFNVEVSDGDFIVFAKINVVENKVLNIENNDDPTYVYPVPARNILYINVGDSKRSSLDMEVISPSGQTLISKRMAPVLDISALDQGSYILKVKQADGMEIIRFLKE